MTIQFNIKFITPLLIGDADTKLDGIGLTGKALRGCWRFWFRAIAGGCLDTVSLCNLPNLLTAVEECIFGSTSKSKFRLLVEPVCMQPGSYAILLHKNFKKQGYDPGSTFKISILLRKDMMTDAEIKVLLSAIWLWGNLGAVGNRARRGFGSPAICVQAGIANPFEDVSVEVQKAENTSSKLCLPIHTQSSFNSINDIENHLKNGIDVAWHVVQNWLKSNELSTKLPNATKSILDSWRKAPPLGNISTNKAPGIAADTTSETKAAMFFILKSLRQVAVNTRSFPLDTIGLEDAIYAVHGTSNCNELGWAPDKNHKDRWASPAFIRFHKVTNKDQEEFCPVATWCQQNMKFTPSNCARKYLNDIGFTNSL